MTELFIDEKVENLFLKKVLMHFYTSVSIFVPFK